ncbi:MULTISPECIES: HAD-IB family hydrolase/lysophospholipid acyltransferase family protein [Mycobacterium]|uniref:L-3-phosphoserine phosphatase n=1 Tax=Mycobacterium kiyosense TaxID=2871094 RepID=A0A9P3UYC3_9MYCO|nr:MULTISPECIES: HAD-IB family hydrolase/lysophospholipid acyltransferase family protein [Mycobacterium]BDB41554.1 L-3-phosphoserine phosphatase [Mycobacterium kiyosense]BDE15146.1 L-3-phosphoserine phosphatase [Mycobacterium sp. 20KCMC460]GLB81629.1 L-3-phosphoserine phosphatase [Mycobacterium kiyosense]GLB87592.1 L-3-phosphoserine phosphatase [Mycobacterium kiyosense]GLB94209.1 L-3-phosphoserine phosphatase [Mycobacterium kiyosense]
MSSADEPDAGSQPKDLRLPGSVAEIMASPPGPKVGAFFDLDGTLVAGFTAVILTQERLRRRDMGVGELLSMVQGALNHSLGRIEFEDLISKASMALAGRLLSDLDEIGERLFNQRIESRIYPEMRELVRAHVARGHTVVLSSSALTIQVNPVARFLGITNTLTNKFETTEDGILTGGVLKPILWGPGKAAAVQRFAAEHDIDLKESYFYADGDEDVALMYLVGNPRPTNPEGKMAAVAKKRGWPILKFDSRGGVGLRRQIRTLAGFSSMVPVAAGAVGLGLLTRNRRRGVNFFTSNFSQLLLTTCGVRLNVLGRENLTAQRPAVFIFNHRNQVDPIISGALVKDNWVGVGKKELERDPVMGPLGKLLDGVFIDRDDVNSAVETLHTVEDRARNGLSIVIAPEGTRLDTNEVGPFKKGPFRIAMSVGIPIVPIVIRNAEIIASRNSTTLNPGTVDVAVFPPIPVDDWTLDTLPDRIAEIRQLYLDTLADWPVGELPEAELYTREKPAKKAPAKKAAAKKAPAKKAAAKKAPAKKAAAKKAPAKRVPAKKAEARATPDATPHESTVTPKSAEPQQHNAEQQPAADASGTRP